MRERGELGHGQAQLAQVVTLQAPAQVTAQVTAASKHLLEFYNPAWLGHITLTWPGLAYPQLHGKLHSTIVLPQAVGTGTGCKAGKGRLHFADEPGVKVQHGILSG